MSTAAAAGSSPGPRRDAPSPAAGRKYAVTDQEFVSLEVDAAIATIRLNRPPMNVINVAVQNQIRVAALECTSREDIRAVVVYGGEKVFAAGADIKEMVGLGYSDVGERNGALGVVIDAVARIPKPVVAAVTGYALGGGCELALAADFRVCADDAKLGQPEVLLGVIPGAGGTQRLARLVGPARAKDLIFTGRLVGAAEAASMGLVDAVVPAAEVYPTALQMMQRYAGGPAQALRAAKAAIDGGLDSDLATGLRLESYLFAGMFATEDRAIGMRSFLENGPGKARFVGR
ncbi:MAG: enoyl-CoA hydratase [Pseudonocardiales bacterium]|nr:MAG: enoyl-CoA hydratase [Pseudonocardiales bacterium]